MTTLLHTCCGPCASACVPRLREAGREVTMLFANSNIDTREEFEKRLREAEKLAAADGVRLVALPYDHEEWLREVAAGYEHEPEKGARCARCFRYNLGKAAAYAAAHGLDEFTTSLTVSPHKDTRTVFAAAAGLPNFLALDFKKREGFRLSTRRAAELGLYRQAYCGCEFSRTPGWRVHHRPETVSTNLDAREGAPGDVFTADFQTAGRGRLDHRWHSPPGVNLMMSAVLSVAGLDCAAVATLPLAVGLAVLRALRDFVPAACALALKWPNDILVDGRKVAGILCERLDDRVIAGIGVNVGRQDFPAAFAVRATALGNLAEPAPAVRDVRDAVLRRLSAVVRRWRKEGFGAFREELARVDFLRGRTVAVRQTDDDSSPISGRANGIMEDGSLEVGGVRVYAGETHVEAF